MKRPSLKVEQAVFAIELKGGGNEVVFKGATDAATDVELRRARELAVCVALPGEIYDPNNLFMFSLPNDSMILGRLTPRRGALEKKKFYLENLFFERELFEVVGGDPVTFLRLALNTTRFALYREGAVLRQFCLERFDPSCVNVDSLNYAASKAGSRALALLVQSILENEETFFLSRHTTFSFISSLFSLLPVWTRRALTFSAGLFFKDVPVNLIGVKAPRNRRRLFFVDEKPFDLDAVARDDGERFLSHPWAVFVDEVLNLGALQFFRDKLANDQTEGVELLTEERGPYLASEKIGLLGKQWGDELEDIAKSGYRGFADEKYKRLELSEDRERDVFYDLLDSWKTEEERRDGEEWKRRDGESDGEDSFSSFSNDALRSEKSETDNTVQFIQDNDVAGWNERDDRFSKTMNERVQLAEQTLAESLREVDSSGVSRGRTDENGGAFLRRERDVSGGTSESRSTETSRGDSLIRDDVDLTPFAILSAEFPRLSVLLRRLDRLARDACARRDNSKLELEKFWHEFVLKVDGVVATRSREEYLRYLSRLTKKDLAPEENCNLAVGVLDVLDVLSSDGRVE